MRMTLPPTQQQQQAHTPSVPATKLQHHVKSFDLRGAHLSRQQILASPTNQLPTDQEQMQLGSPPTNIRRQRYATLDLKNKSINSSPSEKVTLMSKEYPFKPHRPKFLRRRLSPLINNSIVRPEHKVLQFSNYKAYAEHSGITSTEQKF